MRARELSRRRHEVPARQPVQIQKRQHLGDLRVLRAHGGKIAALNRIRSPTTSDRRPLAAGDRQLRQGFRADGGNPVRRTRAQPVRGTSERPLPSRNVPTKPQCYHGISRGGAHG